ncbi:phosphatase PAP2 family protein [Propioniciclava tarda]|uniref:Inositolphosphotransferase Aur1/Ipt1 domain-containing protein n=1 Tax=Propioniciclava tarda TaxID=433330 RepID=A0A4V2JSY2_PROTD|nr:phosphatase PAP2 family protein [Propioniciclava tarda]TBT93148.1 hypothetical protein ET996_11900 [Propioniciclava tarda]SMO75847.1 PAP2 superfamily protein [Propioniciclava tarda]HOA88483.1 phosphatase PAP2 family protein [Propioniciclava tarda]HQA30743.1 phosphatase PAP2 family protein [Propioniciclava tarda]HQD60136.1 phosphatase PAP2 family protein [Propioniciclava tarda]
MTDAAAPGPLGRTRLGRWVWKHRYGLSLLYIPAFIGYFLTTEHRERAHETSVRCALDDKIPFREEWILAYGAWFPYLLGFAGWLYANDKDRSEYKRAYYHLVAGMTIILVIYELWPNRQDLQPATYPRENLFTEVVRRLQTFDSQSNVCPSLHVYTTLCVNDALQSSKLLKHPEIVRPASWVLTGLISASTCFLKQHSVLDGIAAAGLFGVLKAAPRLLRP